MLNDRGIAIGPILFVVAILGILAAAIAAGSGSFSGSAQQEGSRSKAAAIIAAGQNLKFGFDRVVANGVSPDDVIIDPGATSNDRDLYSPTGGGVLPPSNSLASSEYYKWCFSLDGNQQFAVLPVDTDVCREINRLLTGTAAANLGVTDLVEPDTCQFDDPSVTYDEFFNPPAPIKPQSYAYCILGEVGSDQNHGLFVQIFSAR